MDDATLIREMKRHAESSAWQEFEDALRRVLADHEAAVWGKAGAEVHAARRRTVDRIEALYAARSGPEAE